MLIRIMKNMLMSRLVLLLSVLFVCGMVSAQTPAFDRLELYYNQGHYKKVYKESGKLLNKPEHDYSKVPAFYRALSTFQLSENSQWLKARPNSLEDARKMYLDLLATSDGHQVIESHLEDVAALKQDLLNRIGDLQREGKQKDSDILSAVVHDLFEQIPVINDETPVNKSQKEEIVKEFSFNSKNRDEIILFAKQQLGKPYVHSGNTPSGFDCSGFTSYIFSAYQINLPRRSREQYDNSKKIKENKVQKGDLVFFDNGSGVNHVGLIVSEQGESPIMIHASTSQGIVITDIHSSSYWNKRIKGYGTFLE